MVARISYADDNSVFSYYHNCKLLTEDLTVEKLIALMAEGRFYSGESLGCALGITRAAVWKKLQHMIQCGLPVESVRGKGYRLNTCFQPFNAEAIQSGLTNELRKRIDLDVRLSVTSTNDIVRSYRLGGKKMQICVSDYQSVGRGRRGKSWMSPMGASISFSLQRQFYNGLAALDGLSLVIGLAVISVLEDLGCMELMLKWPNDVLWRKRKLSGILVELAGDPNESCSVIIGVGINIKLNHTIKTGINQPVAQLCDLIPVQAFDKNELVANLIHKLVNYMDRFDQEGFRVFANRWQSYDCFLGREVALSISEEKVLIGKAVGISKTGAFLLKINGKQQAFSCGEVSLREVQ